ncbi:hypothetical protein D3068_RS13330 [Enterococcus hirae]|uniref:hypothetical protein n=1 Tax=Enterococcus hirae TaxID=1354 RepID=UPI001897A662|nr:hypothetical protein [Enterococcus hirae]
MDSFNQELYEQLQGSLSDITISAIMGESGVLEGISRNGGHTPTIEDYQKAEQRASETATPVTLEIKQLISGFRKEHLEGSTIRQEKLMERIADKLDPKVDLVAEKIANLTKAMQEAEHVEEAISLANEITELEEFGLPVYEEFKPELPSNEEIARMDVNQATALVNQFPEHTSKILDIVTGFY